MKKIISYLLTIACLIAITMCGVKKTPPKKGKEKTDSLFAVLEKANADTSGVNTLNAVAFEYRSTNPDTSLIFANKALALATKLKNNKGIADSYLSISVALSNSGKSEDALKNLNKALELYNQLLVSDKSADINKIQKKRATVYNTMGFVNMSLVRDLPEALKNHSTALSISQKIGDKTGIALANIKIGLVYYWQGNYTQALKYDSIGLKIYQKVGDKQYTAKAFYNRGLVYMNMGNYPEALKHINSAKHIFDEIDDKEFIARSHYAIGQIYISQGNYPAALKVYDSLLITRKEMGDKKSIANTYIFIGLAHDNQGNYPEALKYYFDALKINEEIGDKAQMADAYSSIAGIYLDQSPRNYTEALKNDSAALKLDKELGDQKSLAGLQCNIGLIYYYQREDDKALKYFTSSFEICKKIGAKDYMANDYENIGNIYYEEGNYTEALKNYFYSLDINKELGIQKDIARMDYHIGDAYTKIHDYSNASEYLNKGLLLAKDTRSFEEIKNSYNTLAVLDSTKGNFNKAFEDYKMFIVYRDSLYNDANTKKLVQTQMQYDFDKKEAATKADQDKRDALAEAALQKQKVLRNIFLGGFAVVLLFAVVFFLQRRRISKEKKRSEELLLNILPSEVADELKEKGYADAKHFEEVTVLFTDFKGFTSISEKLSPADLVKDIDECFKEFDRITTKYGIEKIKTIGDSYMCAGGLPVENKTNPEDCINAALEIRDFMLSQKIKYETAGKPCFEIRIGVHTGPVVAGIVGIKKFAYDIWGDTVNVASRMESSGEVGRVNISGATHDIVKDLFLCEYRGKVMAKNKGEIDMYFVEKKLLN